MNIIKYYYHHFTRTYMQKMLLCLLFLYTLCNSVHCLGQVTDSGNGKKRIFRIANEEFIDTNVVLRGLANKNAAQLLLLGKIYQQGLAGVKQDAADALSLYRRAAELGNDTAMCITALHYEQGN
ncbi:MAG: sel1 repeat family protein, partial [Taibaiella sp.]|nr:sel1 repeat family protein [Taibaiella sp.]